MSQFDVYENNNAATRKLYPLLLDIQHDVLSDLATRIVIPLRVASNFSGKNLENVMPEVTFETRMYFLMTPQASAISVQLLKSPVGTLYESRAEVVAALDFLITGY